MSRQITELEAKSRTSNMGVKHNPKNAQRILNNSIRTHFVITKTQFQMLICITTGYTLMSFGI